ncbi:MAG: acetyl-CoA carboxylase carboxyltransferase subunit beta [Acidobacteria bacterium]|nr:acetyl-CoA carboxylase carboxyltransferase subunit beta [Acidobacteriota bacterium]
MTWFKKEKPPLQSTSEEERNVRTEGLFTKCDDCKSIIWKKELGANAYVCPKCSYHFKIGARRRLELLLDQGEYEEVDSNLRSSDPLHFVDRKTYRERLRETIETTGETEAVINALGSIQGFPVVCASMEYNFIGGSMGSVVGEKITRAIERSIDTRRSLIIVSASGGARMMEGVLSLMQMAKISAALAKLDEKKIPYISLLTDPTTGGVTASFAMLGDLNIAEPKALIGFAGPRVIEQTIRQKLPEGFQRSEFLLEHGMLDAIVHRKDLRDFIAHSLSFMVGGRTTTTEVS